MNVRSNPPQLISIDTNVKEDKALYNGVQKLLALLITAGEAIAYVFSGMYGNVSTELGPLNTTLIILQLIAAGIVVMLLDDLLQSPEPGRVDGYGLGSGISLFIATNTCEMVAWQAFSPLTVARETGTQFEGAVVSLVSSLFSERDKVRAIKNAFYRTNSPNLSSLLATGASGDRRDDRHRHGVRPPPSYRHPFVSPPQPSSSCSSSSSEITVRQKSLTESE